MKTLRIACLLTLFATVALAGCNTAPSAEAPQTAMDAVSADLIKAHVETLSSDEMGGRLPGSEGIEKANQYIADQFQKLGLKPAGADGGWFQPVPMVGKNVVNSPSLRVSGKGAPMTFAYRKEFVGGSDLEDASVNVNGEMIFVGHGINSPENDWNDYESTDVKGKVVMMFVNDPSPDDEPDLFGGTALTYYGRWTYKYEEAARQGAAAVVLIHTTEYAGYRWNVVESSWSGEQFSLERGPNSDPPLKLASWVSQESAERILARAGHTLEELRQAARTRGFKAVPLALTASTSMRQEVRRIQSANVAGVLEGSDPQLRSQYVIFTAHQDHLGTDAALEAKGEDGIYNGAFDNATGVGAVLAIAQAMTQAQPRPRRSVLFLMVTAEEQGLLGSEYYAQNPLIPLKDTAANVNIDGINIIGPTEDIVVVGHGKSELDAVVEAAARRLGQKVLPDQHPNQGYFYRSDQFNFAKKGVPAVYTDNGMEVIGQPAGYGEQKFAEYQESHYHQPSDEIQPDWSWDGAVQHTRLMLDIGWRICNADRMPQWYEGDEFKAARDAQLQED